MPHFAPLARRLALWCCAAVLAPCLAHAGRPLSVDDAGLNEAGQGHIEAWWAGARGSAGAFTLAPAYAPWAGVELAALLARDRAERATVQALSVKWQWQPAPEQGGCHAATSLALQHQPQRSGTGHSVLLIGTCSGS